MRLWLLQRSTGLQSLTHGGAARSSSGPTSLSTQRHTAQQALKADAQRSGARSCTGSTPHAARRHAQTSRKQPFDEGVPPRKRFAAMRALLSPFPNEYR